MKEEIKCAYRKLEQLERLNQMARDNLLGSRKANQIITKAAQAAFERAREARLSGPGAMTPPRKPRRR